MILPTVMMFGCRGQRASNNKRWASLLKFDFHTLPILRPIRVGERFSHSHRTYLPQVVTTDKERYFGTGVNSPSITTTLHIH